MADNKGFFQPVLSGTFARKLMLPVVGALFLLAAIAFPPAWQFGGRQASAVAATKTDAFPTLQGAAALNVARMGFVLTVNGAGFVFGS